MITAIANYSRHNMDELIVQGDNKCGKKFYVYQNKWNKTLFFLQFDSKRKNSLVEWGKEERVLFGKMLRLFFPNVYSEKLMFGYGLGILEFGYIKIALLQM